MTKRKKQWRNRKRENTQEKRLFVPEERVNVVEYNGKKSRTKSTNICTRQMNKRTCNQNSVARSANGNSRSYVRMANERAKNMKIWNVVRRDMMSDQKARSTDEKRHVGVIETTNHQGHKKYTETTEENSKDTIRHFGR